MHGMLTSVQVCAGAAECQSVKTAAVETEVWAGFEVLHTANIGATVTLFAELTAAIQVGNVMEWKP